MMRNLIRISFLILCIAVAIEHSVANLMMNGMNGNVMVGSNPLNNRNVMNRNNPINVDPMPQLNDLRSLISAFRGRKVQKVKKVDTCSAPGAAPGSSSKKSCFFLLNDIKEHSILPYYLNFLKQ